MSELLREVPSARLVSGDPDALVHGVSHDTRTLQPGELFVAVPGFRTNALELVPQAIAARAGAIVGEALPLQPTGTTPIVLVQSARAALADFAAAFYGNPSRQLPVVGVTGTDGKTTVTYLLSAILEAAGLTTGWLSTVSTKIGSQIRQGATDRTTPEAPVVQGSLAAMVAAGVDVAILETSSHALELDRVRGTAYRVGIFTNLSPEHLNFHGTFEAYRNAKGRLFQALSPDGLAVLNADDPASVEFARLTRGRVVTYALDTAADLAATDLRLEPRGTFFTVVAPEGQQKVTSQLIGRFNVANWLAAYGAARYFGATLEHLREAAEHQAPVPGRMNLVQQGQPFPVIVDFAHTPQALGRVLDSVRALVPGRVLLAFGMAGGRDGANRPVMGEVAAAKSDFFLITTDDAYDEDPEQLARAVAGGALAAGASTPDDFDIELDRRTALRTLLARAGPGDAVVLAGHGHEQTLQVNGAARPWNDARAATEELRSLGYERKTHGLP